MTKNKKGFTIIEVVLVLAIAGLIFLMVFIALPALQRSQRNTQREDDISRFLTAANDYQTNNSGKTPFGNGGNANVNANFVRRYIDSTCTSYSSTDGYTCGEGSNEFRDPDGNNYNMRWQGEVASKGTLALGSSDSSAGDNVVVWPNNHMVTAMTNAVCGDEGVANAGTGKRQYALFYVLEGGAITCNDNH